MYWSVVHREPVSWILKLALLAEQSTTLICTFEGVWPAAVHTSGFLYVWPAVVHTTSSLCVTCCSPQQWLSLEYYGHSPQQWPAAVALHVTCCSPQWWLTACDLLQSTVAAFFMWPAVVHTITNNVLFYLLFLQIGVHSPLQNQRTKQLKQTFMSTHSEGQ